MKIRKLVGGVILSLLAFVVVVVTCLWNVAGGYPWWYGLLYWGGIIGFVVLFEWGIKWFLNG